MSAKVAIYTRVNNDLRVQNVTDGPLMDPHRPCLLKSAHTRINGATDLLDLIVQIGRNISRLTGNLKDFGRSASDAVSYSRCEQNGNCCSNESSNAKCGYRFHGASPLLG
jgi:hypothetical protein